MPHYFMPPEIHMFTKKADVYSLGVIFLALLMKEDPAKFVFVGKEKNEIYVKSFFQKVP